MEETLEKRKEEGQAKSEAKGGTPLGAGPLKGIRVLDLGHAGAGSVGPTFLAEWGAEVIKVEIPEGGNVMRKIPPLHQGQSFMHLIQGRNKRSVTVDIHTEMGQEAIRRLVKESDVALENYRPGTLERWNLGYEELKKVKEDVILARHEVPMSPVFSIQDFFEDPHYQARGNILEVADPAMGSVKMQDVVPKLSLTPGRVTSAGPLLGQHNAEVYGNLLGLSEEESGHLREEGVI